MEANQYVFDMYYEELMPKLGFPNSALLRKILERLMTEDEAKIAVALPGSVEEIAGKLSMEKTKVKNVLEGLFKKGLFSFLMF